MKAKYFIPVFLLLSMAVSEIEARIVTATGSGNWESSGTWGGLTPGCGDTIIIPAGISVQITSVLDFSVCSSTMLVNVSGTLSFQTGKKLRLNCASMVIVTAGGWINSGGGGGNSNLIEICLVTVWNTAMGNQSGPVTFGTGPLPVTLGFFSAVEANDHILLNWMTFTEVNNQCFLLQKSTNGKEYWQIARIAGAGTSSNINEYSFKDVNPLNGIQYYRLLQQDYDGVLTTFKPVAIKWEQETILKFFPNPGKGEIFTSLPESFKNMTAKLIVRDMNHGKVLQKDILLGENVSAVLVISKGDNLKPGNYLVSIILNEQKFTRLIMIQ